MTLDSSLAVLGCNCCLCILAPMHRDAICLALQVNRTLVNIRGMASDLDKHSYLTALQERNECLFYKVLSDNIEELLPIIHMPTVSQYCAKFSLMFRSLPRALFISMNDKGG